MQRVDIEIDVMIGDERLKANIYLVGTGQSFGITLGNWHEGYLIKYSAGWLFSASSSKSLIYAEDIFIILDLMKERFPDLGLFETNYQFAPRVNIDSTYDLCYLIPLHQRRMKNR